jgi:TonB-linked SusC/RagA family outer membrane protein
MESKNIYSRFLTNCRKGRFLQKTFGLATLLMLLAGLTTSLQAQGQINVRGRVTDLQGAILSGVTVTVTGTNNVVLTDSNGLYSISAAQASSLRYQFLGYLSQEIVVGSQTEINVALAEDMQGIEEVVVVGYGTMRKSDVTGSIAQIRGDDVTRDHNFNVLDNLRGKAAGVSVFSNGGQSAVYAPRVIIRGASSVNSSTDPLYVVDGVITNDFYLMNPNDIESIEVLKDASSAAIYGARGANGVIMVTTKRGVRGGGVTVTYEGSVSVSNPSRYMPVMNSKEWMEAFATGIKNANKFQRDNLLLGNPNWVPFDENLLTYFTDRDYFDANGNPLYDTDWQREATRTAISHDHQLSIRSGSEQSQIGAFIGYNDNQQVMNNTWTKRVSARMAWDAQPLKWLSTSVNLAVNHTYGRFTAESGGGQDARRTMIEMVPWYPVRDKNGDYTTSATSPLGAVLGLESMSNPVMILDLQKRMVYNTVITGNAALTFHLADGLDLMQQFAISNKDKTYKQHDSRLLANIAASDGGRAQRDYSTNYDWEEKVYLTYNKDFGLHRVNAMAGTEWSSSTYDEARMRIRGLSDFWEWYNMGVGLTQESNESRWRQSSMHSVFARGAYTYDDRYSATVTARYDGSSKFGDNNKYAFFPSAGFAWNASNERFLANNTTISNLRLHTSYGITGNSAINPYQSLASVSSGTLLINGDRAPYGNISSLANPDLKWEKTTMWDIGFELGLFRQRLTFDISYYNKLTTDMLLRAPVPRTTGFDDAMRNIGSVRNRGLDIMITGVPVQTDDFRWTATLNANFNKNRVMQLADGNADIMHIDWVGGPNAIIRVGENLNSFYGYRREGVWTPEDYAAGRCDAYWVGRAKRSNEKFVLGQGTPDWTGSLRNEFTYRNLDLSFDFQFVYGVETMQQFYHSTYDRFGITNGLKNILYDAYDGTNPGTMQQAVYLTGNVARADHSSQVDSSWVVDGSYLRLNSLMLGYTFSPRAVSKLGISKLRLYLSGNNLFLICSRDFTGYDPEATSQFNESANEISYHVAGQNLAFFSLPRARTFTAGLSVTF